MFIGIGISAGAAKRGAAAGPSGPATEGPHYPGSATQGAVGGVQSWTNLSNIQAEDGSTSTCNLGANDTSQTITAADFGFAVPAEAAITGVTVEIRRRRQNLGGLCRDLIVQLNHPDGAPGDNKASGASTWPDTLTTASYGGEADLWGLTLTPEDVNNPDFYFQLKVRDPDNSDVAHVDFVRITVHYST